MVTSKKYFIYQTCLVLSVILFVFEYDSFSVIATFCQLILAIIAGTLFLLMTIKAIKNNSSDDWITILLATISLSCYVFIFLFIDTDGFRKVKMKASNGWDLGSIVLILYTDNTFKLTNTGVLSVKNYRGTFSFNKDTLKLSKSDINLYPKGLFIKTKINNLDVLFSGDSIKEGCYSKLVIHQNK